jgi:hypothetical protein
VANAQTLSLLCRLANLACRPAAAKDAVRVRQGLAVNKAAMREQMLQLCCSSVAADALLWQEVAVHVAAMREREERQVLQLRGSPVAADAVLLQEVTIRARDERRV